MAQERTVSSPLPAASSTADSEVAKATGARPVQLVVGQEGDVCEGRQLPRGKRRISRGVGDPDHLLKGQKEGRVGARIPKKARPLDAVEDTTSSSGCSPVEDDGPLKSCKAADAGSPRGPEVASADFSDSTQDGCGDGMAVDGMQGSYGTPAPAERSAVALSATVTGASGTAPGGGVDLSVTKGTESKLQLPTSGSIPDQQAEAVSRIAHSPSPTSNRRGDGGRAKQLTQRDAVRSRSSQTSDVEQSDDELPLLTPAFYRQTIRHLRLRLHTYRKELGERDQRVAQHQRRTDLAYSALSAIVTGVWGAAAESHTSTKLSAAKPHKESDAPPCNDTNKIVQIKRRSVEVAPHEAPTQKSYHVVVGTEIRSKHRDAPRMQSPEAPLPANRSNGSRDGRFQQASHHPSSPPSHYRSRRESPEPFCCRSPPDLRHRSEIYSSHREERCSNHYRNRSNRFDDDDNLGHSHSRRYQSPEIIRAITCHTHSNAVSGRYHDSSYSHHRLRRADEVSPPSSSRGYHSPPQIASTDVSRRRSSQPLVSYTTSRRGSEGEYRDSTSRGYTAHNRRCLSGDRNDALRPALSRRGGDFSPDRNQSRRNSGAYERQRRQSGEIAVSSSTRPQTDECRDEVAGPPLIKDAFQPGVTFPKVSCDEALRSIASVLFSFNEETAKALVAADETLSKQTSPLCDGRPKITFGTIVASVIQRAKQLSVVPPSRAQELPNQKSLTAVNDRKEGIGVADTCGVKKEGLHIKQEVASEVSQTPDPMQILKSPEEVPSLSADNIKLKATMESQTQCLNELEITKRRLEDRIVVLLSRRLGDIDDKEDNNNSGGSLLLIPSEKRDLTSQGGDGNKAAAQLDADDANDLLASLTRLASLTQQNQFLQSQLAASQSKLEATVEAVQHLKKAQATLAATTLTPTTTSDASKSPAEGKRRTNTARPDSASGPSQSGETRLRELTAELREARIEIKELRAQHCELQASYQRELGQRETKHRLEVQRLQTKLEEKATAIEELKEALACQKAKREMAEAERNDLKQRGDSIAKDLLMANQSILDALKTRRSCVIEDGASDKADKEKFGDLAFLQSDHQRLQAQLAGLSQDLDDVSEVFEAKVKSSLRSDALAKSSADRCLHLIASSAQAEARMRYLESEMEQSKVLTAELQSAGDASRQEIESLNSEVATARGLLIEAKQQSADLNRELKEATVRVDDLLSEIDNLKTELQSKAELEEELGVARKKVAEAESKWIDLKFGIGSFQDDLDGKAFSGVQAKPLKSPASSHQARDAVPFDASEHEALRRRLLCPLCNEQWRDSVITRCGHTFCMGCLKSNQESRNRKCPTCNQKFQKEQILKIFQQ